MYRLSEMDMDGVYSSSSINSTANDRDAALPLTEANTLCPTRKGYGRSGVARTTARLSKHQFQKSFLQDGRWG